MSLFWKWLTRCKKLQIATRIAGYCASSTECSDHSLKEYKKKVFFYKLVSFFSACCNNKISAKKQNSGIFQSHGKIGQFENCFWRKMTRKTKKKHYKFWRNFKTFSIFFANCFWIFKFLVPKIALKTQKTTFCCLNYVFTAEVKLNWAIVSIYGHLISSKLDQKSETSKRFFSFESRL